MGKDAEKASAVMREHIADVSERLLKDFMEPGYVGYSIGFFVPKLFGFTIKQRIAACFEVGVDNAALTMTLAARHFGPLAVLVSILYGKIMVIMGAVLLAPIFQKIEARSSEADQKKIARQKADPAKVGLAP